VLLEGRQDDWDRHWTDFAARATQNPAQAMRRRIIDSLLEVGDGPARVLDIGCGQGDLLAEMHARHPRAELHGIDCSRHGVEAAREKVPHGTFAQRDLMASGDPPAERAAWATHAVCSEVLEHLDEPQALLTNARAYLARGCRLVVTVPGGPMSAFDWHIGHRRHFTVDALWQLLQASGFAVERVMGLGFPFFNLYRLVVISRGERLVGDVSAGSGGPQPTSFPARIAMGAFRPLLALPQPRSRWGWQVVAVARLET